MQSRKILIFSAVFCAIFITVSVSGGGGKNKKKWMERMKKCGDGEINIEEAFKGKEECKAEMKKEKESKGDEEESRRRRSPENEDEEGQSEKTHKKRRRHNTCMHVCQWKKTGLLDESGKFSESGAQEYINKVYPENYRSDAMEKMKECNDDNSSSFSMDNNCKGYKKFERCMFGAHMKVCGIEWKKGGDGKKGKEPANEGGEEE